MGMGFAYQGASGDLYNFLLVNMANPKALPWHGGLFAFAKYTPDPLFFGEGDNLFKAMTTCPEWQKAEELQDITVAYLMLEEDPRKRAAALADLLANHDAPLNRAG
jgi:hypothetical protein